MRMFSFLNIAKDPFVVTRTRGVPILGCLIIIIVALQTTNLPELKQVQPQLSNLVSFRPDCDLTEVQSRLLELSDHSFHKWFGKFHACRIMRPPPISRYVMQARHYFGQHSPFSVSLLPEFVIQEWYWRPRKYVDTFGDGPHFHGPILGALCSCIPICYPIVVSYLLLALACIAVFSCIQASAFDSLMFQAGHTGPAANPAVSVFRSLLSTYRFQRNDPNLFVLCPVYLSYSAFRKNFNSRWQRCAMIVKCARYSDGYHCSVDLVTHHASHTYFSPIVLTNKNEAMNAACWYVYDMESLESQSYTDLLTTALDIMELYLFYVNFAQAPSVMVKCMLVTQFLRARFLMLSYCFAITTLASVEAAAVNLENVFINAKLAGNSAIQHDPSTLGLVHLCEETKRMFPNSSAAAECLRCVEKSFSEIQDSLPLTTDFSPVRNFLPGVYSAMNFIARCYSPPASQPTFAHEVLETPDSLGVSDASTHAAILCTLVRSGAISARVLPILAADPQAFTYFYPH